MDSGFVLTAGGTALISSLVLQALKHSELSIFNFLGTEKEKWSNNLTFSIIIAFITSLGIGYKYDSTAGTLVLSGLTAAGITHGLWHWFFQWISQHAIYKTVVVPTELQAANIEVLNKLLNHLKGEVTPVSVEDIKVITQPKGTNP